MQTYGIFAARCLARPLGGIVMADLGDNVRRKKIFTLPIFLMVILAMAIGLLPIFMRRSASWCCHYWCCFGSCKVWPLAARFPVPGSLSPSMGLTSASASPGGALTAKITVGILLRSFMVTIINQLPNCQHYIATGG
ncbi:hypothetical protein [Sodalis-like endosymbiont of Proechinophthirus fluctus]|uniref:hypothetical protein n=1 Tax=Sodalis-like endosymbiont of Proechinophthirus fluctus TaxID=1462730 RepID=UPI000A635CC9|nr:hypothetical protein [Sodalis-like endosymbiont of Proechinophthirus fluctus]